MFFNITVDLNYVSDQYTGKQLYKTFHMTLKGHMINYKQMV